MIWQMPHNCHIIFIHWHGNLGLFNNYKKNYLQNTNNRTNPLICRRPTKRNSVHTTNAATTSFYKKKIHRFGSSYRTKSGGACEWSIKIVFFFERRLLFLDYHERIMKNPWTIMGFSFSLLYSSYLWEYMFLESGLISRYSINFERTRSTT